MKEISYLKFREIMPFSYALVSRKVRKKKVFFKDSVYLNEVADVFSRFKYEEFYVNPWYASDKKHFTQNKFILFISEFPIPIFIRSENLRGKENLFYEINEQIKRLKKVDPHYNNKKVDKNVFYPEIFYRFKSIKAVLNDPFIKKYSINEMTAISSKRFLCWTHEGDLFSSQKLKK